VPHSRRLRMIIDHGHGGKREQHLCFRFLPSLRCSASTLRATLLGQ
jgi:hypothetical protein